MMKTLRWYFLLCHSVLFMPLSLWVTTMRPPHCMKRSIFSRNHHRGLVWDLRQLKIHRLSQSVKLKAINCQESMQIDKISSRSRSSSPLDWMKCLHINHNIRTLFVCVCFLWEDPKIRLSWTGMFSYCEKKDLFQTNRNHKYEQFVYLQVDYGWKMTTYKPRNNGTVFKIKYHLILIQNGLKTPHRSFKINFEIFEHICINIYQLCLRWVQLQLTSSLLQTKRRRQKRKGHFLKRICGWLQVWAK